MRTALVYDRVNKWGGAERVLLALHEIFPDAPLFTSVYHPVKAPWASVFPKVYSSFLNRLPPLRHRHEMLAPLMPHAFESFKFDGYDLVISVTSEAAKGVITSPNTLHICYCLTPTRYLWSGYDSYFDKPLHKTLTKPVINYLRRWDKQAARRPDVIVAISTEVQKRIKKYYGRDSELIYPPVNFLKQSATLLHSTVAKRKIKNKTVGGDYFLVASRLVPYKRVDLAIEAFNKLKKPLYIIGTGSEEKRLKKMAGKTVKFLGQLTDVELFHYYDKAKGLIMPQEEDFGLVALEAQSFGVPVIAYKAGGVLDTVIEGTTGIFFKTQTVQSLVNAIERFEKSSFKVADLIANSANFSFERFKKEITNLINRNLK